MAITTVAVSVHVDDTNGVLVGAKVNAKLNRVEVYQGHIVPEFTTATTDANGDATLNLWPNALGITESSYEITIIDPTSRHVASFLATIPNSACNLWDVANLPAYPGKSDSQRAADAALVSETAAAASETAAAASETAAAASYDSFDDRYLGAKATAPTLDNDGNTLLVGAMYFNTGTNIMYAWSGSAWGATFPATTSITDNGNAVAITIGPDESSTFASTVTNKIGTDVVSAAELTLGIGNYFDVTGTNVIKSINSVGVGTRVTLQFDSALRLENEGKDIVFLDNNAARLIMYRWHDSVLTLIGEGTVISSTSNPAITALNSTDVAAISDATDLSTYRWDGSTWTLVGSKLNIATAGTTAITALDSTTIAFTDTVLGELRTYGWSGSAWTQTGNGLAITSIGSSAIATLDSTTVAFVDNANDSLRTYSWSGSDWTQTGTGLSISTVGIPTLTALDSTTVAFFDDTNIQLRTYGWSGSVWSLTGTGLTITGAGDGAIAAIDSTTVAFTDDNNDEIRVYSWSGSAWSQAGSSFEPFYAVTVPSLTFMGPNAVLSLPGKLDITTATGDVGVFFEYAAGDWRCDSYTRADSKPLLYEEGTWTPVLSDGTNDATMNTATTDGKYVKIGNLVHISGQIKITNIGSASGFMRILGLPFAAYSGTNAVGGIACTKGGTLTITAGTYITAFVQNGNTYLSLTLWNSAGGTSVLTDAAFNNNAELTFHGTYITEF